LLIDVKVIVVRYPVGAVSFMSKICEVTVYTWDVDAACTPLALTVCIVKFDIVELPETVILLPLGKLYSPFVPGVAATPLISMVRPLAG